MAATLPRNDLSKRYDAVSDAWADKMRVLGYYDGYLGFLSHWQSAGQSAARVADIGTGTGAMAEAWVAINGAPGTLTLVDPAPAMLARASAMLQRRSVAPLTVAAPLSAQVVAPQDHLLAAHVIEHVADPGQALRDMRRLVVDGGRLWLVASRPHWCNVLIWLKWRHRTFRPEQITELLTDAGFALEETYGFPSGPPSRTSTGYVARAI